MSAITLRRILGIPVANYSQPWVYCVFDVAIEKASGYYRTTWTKWGYNEEPGAVGDPLPPGSSLGNWPAVTVEGGGYVGDVFTRSPGSNFETQAAITGSLNTAALIDYKTATGPNSAIKYTFGPDSASHTWSFMVTDDWEIYEFERIGNYGIQIVGTLRPAAIPRIRMKASKGIAIDGGGP